eukprot:m.98934 g.98934  ORF g.98934 m.98934 type:complete len:382 (-) comp15568_c0_seq2:1679-2824(-)
MTLPCGAVQRSLLLLAACCMCVLIQCSGVHGWGCSVREEAKQPGVVSRALSDKPVAEYSWWNARFGTNLMCGIEGLIGQHIATRDLVTQVRSHLQNDSPLKPLVAVLFGDIGTGKTMFCYRLAHAIYDCVDWDGVGKPVLVISGSQIRKGDRHVFMQRIANHVAAFPRSMIIIDEPNLASKGELEGLLPFLGHDQPVTYEGQRIDFRKAMFFFTSNVGLKEVTRHYQDLMQSKARHSLTHEDFRSLLSDTTIDHISEILMLRGRFDFYVPFLPITATEVKTYAQRFLEARRCRGQKAGEFRTLQWSDAVVDFLTAQVFAGQEDAPFSELGLAINPLFNAVDLAIDKLLEELPQAYAATIVLVCEDEQLVATTEAKHVHSSL